MQDKRGGGANDADDKMDGGDKALRVQSSEYKPAFSGQMVEGDGDGDDKDGEEEFFNFHPQQNDKLYSKKKTVRGNQLDVDRNKQHDEDDSARNSNQGLQGSNLQIDSLFGRIFGIERVHILSKYDKLHDVIEKISIIPENKLVFVENTTVVVGKEGAGGGGGFGGLNQESDEEDN